MCVSACECGRACPCDPFLTSHWPNAVRDVAYSCVHPCVCVCALCVCNLSTEDAGCLNSSALAQQVQRDTCTYISQRYYGSRPSTWWQLVTGVRFWTERTTKRTDCILSSLSPTAPANMQSCQVVISSDLLDEGIKHAGSSCYKKQMISIVERSCWFYYVDLLKMSPGGELGTLTEEAWAPRHRQSARQYNRQSCAGVLSC